MKNYSKELKKYSKLANNDESSNTSLFDIRFMVSDINESTITLLMDFQNLLHIKPFQEYNINKLYDLYSQKVKGGDKDDVLLALSVISKLKNKFGTPLFKKLSSNSFKLLSNVSNAITTEPVKDEPTEPVKATKSTTKSVKATKSTTKSKSTKSTTK